MKTYFSFKNGLGFGLVLLLLFTSCQTDEFTETAVVKEDLTTTETVEETDPTLRVNNSLVFPKTAQIFGKSAADWAIEFGKTVYGLDCESIFENQMLRLADNVVAPFGSLESGTDEFTISKDQYVLLSPILTLNNYPCPEEYEHEPAEGQSLEDFLKEGAASNIDPVEKVEVFINGIEIDEPMKYRLSTDLFYFTGNPELAECVDPCITGMPQQMVIDGFFMMLKKMKVGKHTIFARVEIPSEDVYYDWNLILNVVK